MKKLFLIPLLFLTLFTYMNNVNADSIYTINYDLSTNSSYSNYSYSDMKSFYNNKSEIFNSAMNDFLNAYSSYSETYPYYYLSFFDNSNQGNSGNFQFQFNLLSSIPSVPISSNYPSPSDAYVRCLYDVSNNSFFDTCSTVVIGSSSYSFYYYVDSSHGHFMADRYFFSNFDLKFSNPTGINIGYEASYGSFSKQWLSSDNNPIPSVYDFYELSFYDEYVPSDYVEVDLNSYDYIILTLKNYNQPQFTSTIEVLGSLCLTPVYNYGMTPKSNYFQNTQTPPCSLRYDSYTPTSLYILTSDLQNHAVYYIKSPDTTLTNKIKYDSSKFNLFTFNFQTGSEPTITIDGRPYSALPYTELTDTAIISTDEGYIPGETCAVGDIECSSSASGIDISNLFTHPLDLLETLWTSITSVFVTINLFISILPPTLQTFLYVSFMLIVILGILRYLLG